MCNVLCYIAMVVCIPQVDVFTVEAVELGKVHSLSLRNASEDPSQAWLLQKVVVKASPKAEQEFFFPSAQWLGATAPDSQDLQTAQSQVQLLLQGMLILVAWLCVKSEGPCQ